MNLPLLEERQSRRVPVACPPMTRASAPAVMPRLVAIEGLRAWLALWVLVCHVLWCSGIHSDTSLPFLQLLVKGNYAVQLFMIVSGFVIFLLLDKQGESYRQFVVRRFFRLFPLFLVVFLVAIPLSRLASWDAAHSTQYWSAHQIDYFTAEVQSWWSNIAWHVPLHLSMLHGAVPPALLPDSSFAFLVLAWSLSLEWQFYLLAPLAYALAVGSRPLHRVALCGLCVLGYVSAAFVNRAFPQWNSGAALPSFLPFFFLGAGSYFLYQRHRAKPVFEAPFPVLATIAVFLLVLGGGSKLHLTPVILWIAFLGLILEPPSSRSSRLVSPLFTNRPIQYIGRISYSFYLIHLPLLALVQYPLLKFFPELSRPAHFWLLLAFATPLSIALSALSYRFLEAPGIRLGQSLALKLAHPPGPRECVRRGVRTTLVP